MRQKKNREEKLVPFIVSPTIVVLEHIEGTIYKPITARDMTDREKRNFKT